ncbi:hypothetical protein V8F20_007919 [Naviculisporaceae sp. PSN 640]
MKAVSGFTLLSVVTGFSGVVTAGETTANTAGTAQKWSKAEISEMASGYQAQALTEWTPYGWRAYGGQYGHRHGASGSGSGSGSGGGTTVIIEAAECNAPYELCGNTCADVRASADYCGSCDTECPIFGRCFNGDCFCPPELMCLSQAGICLDPMDSNDACGEDCTPCSMAQDCRGGFCVCPTDEEPDFCEEPGTSQDYCTNLAESDDNCGACGFSCPAGSTCAYVRDTPALTILDPSPCDCEDPLLTVCDFDLFTGGGICVNLQIADPQYCGSCLNSCVGDTPYCVYDFDIDEWACSATPAP